MLNYEEHGRTELITVVVAVLDDGEVELLSVKGRKKPVNDDFLSDVDWFNDHFDAVGARLMLFDDEDVESGKYRFTGIMIADRSWTEYGWEYDDYFEIDEYRKL